MKERGCGPAMTWSSTSEASICPGAPANCWCAAIRERLAPRAAASLLRCVSLPYILQCQGQGLCLHAAVTVHSVLRKDKLVRIPLGGQSLGHALIGEDPVVIVVAGDENVAIADMHPDAQRLLRAVGNEGFMELPCAVRGLGVVRPLLVHERARVAQNTVVEISVIPGHRQRGRS